MWGTIWTRLKRINDVAEVGFHRFLIKRIWRALRMGGSRGGDRGPETHPPPPPPPPGILAKMCLSDS